MKFKKGDRVYWRDSIVGRSVGIVKAAWIDSRIGEALYVEREGHDGEMYPVNVKGDGASKLPLPFLIGDRVFARATDGESFVPAVVTDVDDDVTTPGYWVETRAGRYFYAFKRNVLEPRQHQRVDAGPRSCS